MVTTPLTGKGFLLRKLGRLHGGTSGGMSGHFTVWRLLLGFLKMTARFMECQDPFWFWFSVLTETRCVLALKLQTLSDLFSDVPCKESGDLQAKRSEILSHKGHLYLLCHRGSASSAVQSEGGKQRPPWVCSLQMSKVKFRAKCVGLSFKRVDVMLLPAVWEKDSQILLN